MDLKEIEFAVPWGIITAKAWGNSSDPLVLAVHGWADNASSFDPLIPLLPNTFYYVCIDLPGHAKSSPLKTSLILRDIDYVMVIKLIYDLLKRDKIILMGHSMGGFISTVFAQIYPECVSKIMVFDALHFFPRPQGFQFGILRHCFNQRIRFIAKETDKGPEYTREEIMHRMMTGRGTPLSRKAAEILIDRNLEPASDGKYRIRVAQNVKRILITSFSLESIVDTIRKYPIRCPHLIILSSNSSHIKIACKEIHNAYKKNNSYEFHIVEGPHEIHLENPEEVACIVSNFLLKQVHKL